VISKDYTDIIYPTMVIRSQAETIELQEKEIERLNNIIDGLEKWLKHYIPLLEAGDIVEETTQDTLKEVLDKLNELKGDNK
jgi:hypothetical protein